MKKNIQQSKKLSFEEKDWVLVIRSIEAQYKETGAKHNKYDEHGTKDSWISKTEAEKLAYVKKAPYPRGLHNAVWNSMSQAIRARFNSLKNTPNPESEVKVSNSREFTTEDWDLVVHSIDSWYNDKVKEVVNPFDKTGTREHWQAKSPEERLAYVKTKDYPRGIYEGVWKKLPKEVTNRFHSMQGVKNPASIEKYSKIDYKHFTNEDWLLAKENVEELVKAKSKKLPHFVTPAEWVKLTNDEQMTLLQRHPYPKSFHDQFFHDLTPHQRARLMFIQKNDIIPVYLPKVIEKLAPIENTVAIEKPLEAKSEKIKLKATILQPWEGSPARKPRLIETEQKIALNVLEEGFTEVLYGLKQKQFNLAFNHRKVVTTRSIGSDNTLNKQVSSRFRFKNSTAYQRKNAQVKNLISFYLTAAAPKKNLRSRTFSALFGVLFKREKTTILRPKKQKRWLTAYKKGKHKVFKKALKKFFVDRYRWHKNDDFLRYKMFRKFFKRQFSRFRHISKNRLFIELFRGHFHELTGFSELNMMHLWFQFRRGTNKYWGHTNLVQKFSQSILLMPHNLMLFFNLAPSLSAARALVQSGALVINGLTSIDLKYFVKPGDTIQITPRIWSAIKRIYSYQKWSYLQRKITYVSFFQIDWSMLLFTMLSWPRSFELIAPSFLSERWIRYYIRQFPVRTRKYQKVKTIWKEYPRIKGIKRQ